MANELVRGQSNCFWSAEKRRKEKRRAGQGDQGDGIDPADEIIASVAADEARG